MPCKKTPCGAILACQCHRTFASRFCAPHALSLSPSLCVSVCLCASWRVCLFVRASVWQSPCLCLWISLSFHLSLSPYLSHSNKRQSQSSTLEQAPASEAPLPTTLTPMDVVARLDDYIIGQENAKRAVAIALRTRWRRQHLSNDLRNEVRPVCLCAGQGRSIGLHVLDTLRGWLRAVCAGKAWPR